MSLERMFAAVQGLQNTASARAILGEPQQVEGRVLIPVAAVYSRLALGFVQNADNEQEVAGESPLGGAGGVTGVRPVAVIEVTPGETTIKPVVDEARITMAGIALLAWTVFWLAATLHSIFGRSCCRGDSN